MTGRPVSEPKATTRISAPSSARMFAATRSAMQVERGGVDALDAVLLHALAQDRQARGEVGRPDVGDQAGLEALAQAVLERVEVARQAVGGEHELRAGVVQRVEGVEELLLGAGLALRGTGRRRRAGRRRRGRRALKASSRAGVQRADEAVGEGLDRRVADGQPVAVAR